MYLVAHWATQHWVAESFQSFSFSMPLSENLWRGSHSFNIETITMRFQHPYCFSFLSLFLLIFKVKVKSLSCVWLFETPWTVAYQAPPSMGFPRQEYWNGLPFPSPGDLPDPEIEPGSPALEADTLTSEPPGMGWIKIVTKATHVRNIHYYT